MKLNKTSQYAIRVMVLISNNHEKDLLSAKYIAQELSIPYKYLTSIMTQLADAGLINSTRGKFGGYSLNKETSAIKIIDILEAVKESMDGKNCLLGIGLCSDGEKCAMHDQWVEPKKVLLNMLNSTTLFDLQS